MGRKKDVERLFHQTLSNKLVFGQSKKAAKKDLGFGQSTYQIYSVNSYKTYLKQCKQYAKWLKQEKGINKIDDINKTEQYAKEYIQKRMDDGKSIYTVKMERSALGMLYGKQIDIKLPSRTPDQITRSRKETKNDRYISRDGKYKDVFTIAIATGSRRKDISKLCVNNFREVDGKLYVYFERSKGGRDRLTPVLEKYEKDVRDIIEQAKNEGKTRLFNHIPKEIDIHGLRREYCQGLYDEIKDNKELRNEILKNYPERRELKTQKDKNGNTVTKEIKSDVYKDRSGNVWKRDDIYVLSQALGHNRLDVSITHYLKS
jgi:integrase